MMHIYRFIITTSLSPYYLNTLESEMEEYVDADILSSGDVWIQGSALFYSNGCLELYRLTAQYGTGHWGTVKACVSLVLLCA